MKDYNIESQHSKLIEDLKSLPKVKAPENFEYNLMTRIQNKNFGETEKERVPFNLAKFLAPSAVVVTGLILFFLFFSPGQQTENPFMSEPPAIVSDSQATAVGQNLTVNSGVTSPQLETQRTESGTNMKSNLKAEVEPNDVVVSKRNKYPLNRNRSIALDDFISGDSQHQSSMQRGSVVNEGEGTPVFDGFLIKQQADKDTVAKYRALIDSVNKANRRADSLKKAQK